MRAIDYALLRVTDYALPHVPDYALVRILSDHPVSQHCLMACSLLFSHYLTPAQS